MNVSVSDHLSISKLEGRGEWPNEKCFRGEGHPSNNPIYRGRGNFTYPVSFCYKHQDKLSTLACTNVLLQNPEETIGSNIYLSTLIDK